MTATLVKQILFGDNKFNPREQKAKFFYDLQKTAVWLINAFETYYQNTLENNHLQTMTKLEAINDFYWMAKQKNFDRNDPGSAFIVEAAITIWLIHNDNKFE